MNFTREPIIETVITPREGCKLVVRSSKGNGQEDYYVDAVEVVSFGHSFFFRSLEKPKSFLVPVSDYEILELRETRMVLKSVSSERSIKIGGGKDAPTRSRDIPASEDKHRQEELSHQQGSLDESSLEGQGPTQASDKADRKRDRRRRSRRGGRDRGTSAASDSREPRTPQAHAEEQRLMAAAQEPETEGTEMVEGNAVQEEQKAPSFISKLFPPPPMLIKETLGRYKAIESADEEALPGAVETNPKEPTEEAMFDPYTLDEEDQNLFHEEDEPKE